MTNSKTGKLYIAATPIGNREDITIRALKTLFAVDLIFCEDTRKTYQLLKYYQSDYAQSRSMPKLDSFFEGNELKKMPQIIALLKQGKNVALVSNAGTPLVSDPGYKLVRECIRENIPVTSLPGPCAAISGLTVSGMPTDKFLFLGFLPRKKSKREKIFNSIKIVKKELNPTIVIYESPYRLAKTLQDLKQVFGDIEVMIARELTKKFEEVKRGKLTELCQKGSMKIKGEIVIFI